MYPRRPSVTDSVGSCATGAFNTFITSGPFKYIRHFWTSGVVSFECEITYGKVRGDYLVRTQREVVSLVKTQRNEGSRGFFTTWQDILHVRWSMESSKPHVHSVSPEIITQWFCHVIWPKCSDCGKHPGDQEKAALANIRLMANKFPPLNSTGRPYALQEYNGRILTGNYEEFRKMAQCDSMREFPFVERSQLNSLQHSISKSDVSDTYVFREADRLKQAMDRWEKDGLTGIIDHVANITEDSKFWPISRLSRGVLRMRNGLANVASHVLPTLNQDRIEELLQRYSSTMNWKSNWLRCAAAHEEGRRFAICQINNYIRIYNIGGGQKTPLTLNHPLQTNVACMAWEPFDQRVLAVAANSKILIWRLTVKATNIKPSVRCAQLIELSTQPIIQIIWDRTTTNVILAVSPNSNKIMIVDISTGEIDSFGAWTGGNITRIVPTSDGRRIAVLYTGNVLRVYDRSSWREERWSSLPGRAVAAVWSLAGDSLLFATEDSYQLYALSFVAKNEINEDGISEARWTGDTRALPVFDLSPVEFDPSELEIEGAVEREIVTIGGKVQNLNLSADGQRLAISFKENPGVVALFAVNWQPVVRLCPIGFVEAPLCGHPSIQLFIPKFSGGSMLATVWSAGSIHYLPLLYGGGSSSQFGSRTIVDEISSLSSPGRRIVNDSLRSSELPSDVIDGSDDDILLFSEKYRAERSVEES